MRTVANPNVRIQDGPTEEWLCEACEQLLSGWEKPFAERVFSVVHAKSEDLMPITYEAWALKFAVSVSWRTLLYYRQKDIKHLSAEDLACVEQADSAWRDFLLGRSPHPKQFENHVILVDALAKLEGPPISPFLNRYFLRAIHVDLVTSKSMCITYSKLGRVVIIGFLRMRSPRRWVGTKLHVRSGQVGGSIEIPSLLADYWNDKANQAANALASMSDSQFEKIDRVFEETDKEWLALSEPFRAMKADVNFSGKEAFRIAGRGGEKDRGGG